MRTQARAGQWGSESGCEGSAGFANCSDTLVLQSYVTFTVRKQSKTSYQGFTKTHYIIID